MLIFEGPDGAGKTTLIDQLRQRLGEPDRLWHSTPPPPGQDKAVTFLPALTRKGRHWLDRSWLSELVYGSILRGHSTIDVPRRRVLERLALTRHVLQIWCQPSYTVCRTNWASRKADELVQDDGDYQRIYHAYTKLRHEHRLPTVHYDYTQHEVDTVVEAVLKHGEGHTGPGVGSFHTGKCILLVGERPNPKSGTYLGPFCSWKTNGSAAWLAWQLELAGIPERSLYWVNANEQGEDTDPAFLKRLRPAHVVALGKVAEAWCELVGQVPYYHTVPHPAYWMRFHRDDEYPLPNVLASCLDVAREKTRPPRLEWA